jgi:hypothetical protein
MSTRILSLKEKLTSINSILIKTKFNEGKTASLQIRLSKITNVLLENESKIWLRTRVGEPMLKEFQEAVDTVFKVLEEGDSSPESFEAALREVERNATKIDEESQRRNMVVT